MSFLPTTWLIGVVLDEADHLADRVAILQAPGRLLALDGPVALKTRLGRGLTLTSNAAKAQRAVFSADEGDFDSVREKVQELLADRAAGKDGHLKVNSTSFEEVFLQLNSSPVINVADLEASTILHPPKDGALNKGGTDLVLSSGQTRPRFSSLLIGASTFLAKRVIVARRAWSLPALTIVAVICAACVPLFFISNRHQTCAFVTDEATLAAITYPFSLFPSSLSPLLLAPFNATALALPNVQSFASNATLLQTLTDHIGSITFGAVSLPVGDAEGLIAWEGTSLANKGLSVLNWYNNIMLDRIRPANGPAINLNFQYLASPDMTSDLQAVKWVIFL